MLFATLRFCFALFPAALFVKRPAVSWGSLAAYGVLIGFGQFGLLYIAMDGYISPGLASLVVQMQVFFTIALPLVRSGLVATLLLVLILAWNEYLLALFLSDANAQTMPVLVSR